jgi:hypothetical protein
MSHALTSSGAYTFDKTLAFILLNEDNHVKDCDIYDLEKKANAAFKKVADLKLTLKVITFEEMRWILTECQQLIELPSSSTLDLTEMKNKTKLGINSRNLLSGLIPGN